LGAFRHKYFGDHAFVDGFDFHRGFVGFDLGDDLAGFDSVAGFDVPLGEIALLHGGRQRGHGDVGHGWS